MVTQLKLVSVRSVGQTIDFCRLLVCREPGARPWPLAWGAFQTGFYRIALYIGDQILEFRRRADPMVERFALPECRSGSSQNPVCPTSRSALQPSHDARHFGE